MHSLNLSGNKIKDLEELKTLESFKELELLDLFNNEATAIDTYRQQIFTMIPSLVYLDGFDVNDVEAESDGDDDDEANGNDSEEEPEDGKFQYLSTHSAVYTIRFLSRLGSTWMRGSTSSSIVK